MSEVLRMPEPPEDSDTLVLRLSKAEVVYIGNVLGERPWREVAGLLQKFDQQIAPQMHPSDEPRK